jgi:hypothetical protein
VDPIVESVIVLASGRAHDVTYTIKTHIRGGGGGGVAGYTLSWWQVLKGIFEGGRGQRMRER